MTGYEEQQPTEHKLIGLISEGACRIECSLLGIPKLNPNEDIKITLWYKGSDWTFDNHFKPTIEGTLTLFDDWLSEGEPELPLYVSEGTLPNLRFSLKRRFVDREVTD